MTLKLLLTDGKLTLKDGKLVVTQNAAECECCEPTCGACYEYVDIVLPGLTDNVLSCCNEIDILSYQIPLDSSTYNPSGPSLDCYYEKTTGFTNAGCEITKIAVLFHYSIALNQMSITVRVDGPVEFSGLVRKLVEFSSGTLDCTGGPWSIVLTSPDGCTTSGSVSITAGPAV